ncbi:MAG TPA: hypothetical protein VHC20_05590 [Candidatus Paceibacterota bacterium]|nr:hypothetical protein [Candidatus Paceibacterota bacterium]
MLKRNGEPYEHAGAQALNRGETDAYNEAFENIRAELEGLKRARDHVREVTNNPVAFTTSGEPAAGAVITTRNVPPDQWEICSTLLNLRNSRVFLCKRAIAGRTEFAIIQTYPSNSPYAQANGDTELLMAGGDAVALVQDCALAAQHTLHLIAGNLIAKAHKIVWARFANTSPVRVVNAISVACAQAASLHEAEQRQNPSVEASRPVAMGQRA